MNTNELIKYMTDTLNRLYICRNNSSGIVRSDVYSAILYYKRMLIKNDCILAYTDNDDIKLSNKALSDTLFYVASDIQYFNSLFNDDDLVNAWWYVCLAKNELDIDNSKVNGTSRKRVMNNKVIE